MTEETKDEFDETIDEEDPDKVSGDDSKKPEEKPEEEPVSIETLQSQIGELQKESEGRLQALRAERLERQELKGKVDAVVGMVNQARTIKAEPEKTEKVPISYNEEGDPFVDPKLITAGLQEKITRLETALQTNQATQNQQTAIQTEINAVVSRDADYKPAYETLSNAYAFISRHLEDHILKQGIDPKTLKNINEALDLLDESEPFKVEFIKQYPHLTPDLVVEAILPTPSGYVNKRKLTQALKKLKSPKQEKKEGLSDTLKFLTKKPSNLTSVRNQHGATESSLDNVASMDIDDFLGMSDQQVNELEKVLSDEEMRG